MKLTNERPIPMDLNHPAVQAVRASLKEAAEAAPVVRRLLNGTLEPHEFEKLAKACEALGVPELAPIVRQISQGTPKELVLAQVVEAAGLGPTLLELGQLAGEGADLVRALKALVKGI